MISHCEFLLFACSSHKQSIFIFSWHAGVATLQNLMVLEANVIWRSVLPNSKWESSALMLSGDKSKLLEGCDSLMNE